MDGCDWAGVFEFNHCPDYLKADHYAGLYLLISTVLAAITIVWMHSQMGMVRLLGIVHIVLWPPMIINAWKRLRNGPLAKLQTVFMAILIITCILAMVCDFYDVARWQIGQRAAIV
ncbi:MAG: hypothetical protein ACR2O8_08355 [Rhizobiaceae bacterium]